ncbi:CLUMA_CG002683, isoform A [Clunio marinus]|uniref:CLUMA_CG002683, isoform A n=1 Tax=Clunio marinus TaxID=568069 RepID=A0A1J1HL12_9DIPT|nr:CLUMA_CG002683, isoform A [Clunio marinus]
MYFNISYFKPRLNFEAYLEKNVLVL